LSIAIDDADVEVGCEQGDFGSGETPSETDVVESRVVPDGDGAGFVDGVTADPPVRVYDEAVRSGFGACGVGLGGGAATDSAVRTVVVVVVAERVQLGLQRAQGPRRGRSGRCPDPVAPRRPDPTAGGYVMARFRRPNAVITRHELGRLLEVELPLPDPMTDRDGWRYVMGRRYDRAAELGFDQVDVLRCARDETLVRARTAR
jgi:hypothetical protein